MKKLETEIRPFKLDEVRDNLDQIGIKNLTIIDIRSSHGQDEHDDSYLTEDYIIEFMPKIKLEVIIEDSQLDEVVSAIKKSTEESDQHETNVLVFDIEKIL